MLGSIMNMTMNKEGNGCRGVLERKPLPCRSRWVPMVSTSALSTTNAQDRSLFCFYTFHSQQKNLADSLEQVSDSGMTLTNYTITAGRNALADRPLQNSQPNPPLSPCGVLLLLACVRRSARSAPTQLYLSIQHTVCAPPRTTTGARKNTDSERACALA